jgi:aldehyde dehydrogenase (NAD+)
MSTVTAESYPAIIGGEKVDAVQTFEDLDPSTGQPCALVARCGKGEIDQAVEVARRAHADAWRRTIPAERARVLHRIAELLRRDHEEVARLESMDTGKPLTQARADATVAARYFEFYANTVESFYGDTIPALEGTFVYTLREPYGVTAHIIPWNYPIQISSRSVAPALAAGNYDIRVIRPPGLLDGLENPGDNRPVGNLGDSTIPNLTLAMGQSIANNDFGLSAAISKRRFLASSS